MVGEAMAHDRLSIAEIIARTPPGDTVTVRGRVHRLGRRPLPNGPVVTEGHLRDPTGTIPFIAWTEFEPARGAFVEIREGRLGTWRGRRQIEIEDGTDVRRRAGPPPGWHRPSPDDLAALRVGDRVVNTTAAILDAESATVESDGPQRVCRGVLGDGNVRLPFIDWSGPGRLEPASIVRLENVYVGRHRGIRSVNLSKYSTVTQTDRAQDRPPYLARRSIRAAREWGSSLNVALAGTIVRLLDGSGAIVRCPDCGRVLGDRRCRRHGKVEPAPDLRVKAILDDGTGTVLLVLGAEITASIYGAGIKEAHTEARGRMGDHVSDAIANAIVGRAHRVRGRLSVEDGEARLTAERFEPLETPPRRWAGRALEGLEG